MWRYDIVNSVTGDRITQVDPSSFSGGTALNDTIDGSVGLNLSHLTLDQARGVVSKVEASRALIVQSWVSDEHPDGYAISAAYMLPQSWSMPSWSYTASTADLWWVLDGRTGIGVGANAAHSYYPILNSSFSNYVRRLLEIAQNNTEAADELPVNLPPATSGPRNWRLYGYNAPVIGDLLREVCEEETGPEVWFQPTWEGAGFRWQTHVSTALNQSLPAFEVQLGAERNNAFNVSLAEDVGSMATRVTVSGEGEGRSKIMYAASSGTTPYPTRERIITASNVKTYAQAQELARGGLSIGPTVEMSLKVRAEGIRDHEGKIIPGTGVTALKPGMPVRVHLNDDHPKWPAGTVFEKRLSGYSTDGTESVTLHTY